MKKRDISGMVLLILGIIFILLKDLIGLALIIAGIAGLFLPIIPGIILLFLGLYLLSPVLLAKIKNKVKNKFRSFYK